MRVRILILAIAATLCGAATARAQFSYIGAGIRGELYDNNSITDWSWSSPDPPSSYSYTLPPTTYIPEDGIIINASAHMWVTCESNLSISGVSSHLSVSGPSCDVVFCGIHVEEDHTAPLGTMILGWAWIQEQDFGGYIAPGDSMELGITGHTEWNSNQSAAASVYLISQQAGPFSIPLNGQTEGPFPYGCQPVTPYAYTSWDIYIKIDHQGGDNASWVDIGDPFCGTGGSTGPVDSTWTGSTTNPDPATNNLWTAAANWSPQMPNGQGATASFTGNAPATVYLDGPKVVGRLLLSGSNSYTIAPLTYPSIETLLLDNTGAPGGGNALIEAQSGTHTIAAQVSSGGTGDLDVVVDSGASLTISTGVAGIVGIDNTNRKTVTLINNNLPSTSPTLIVGGIINAGTLTVTGGTSSLGDVTDAGIMNVTGTGTTVICTSIQQSAITVDSGASLTISNGVADVAGIINAGTLTVTGGTSSLGDVTGVMGTLNVTGTDTTVICTSIQQDTLTIGAGATVTIQAITGGPLGNKIAPVPEPSTLVLLGIGAISLLAYAWRRRK